MEMACDLLNELAEENEQLKYVLRDLQVDPQAAIKDNKQVIEELRKETEYLKQRIKKLEQTRLTLKK
jgi:predicted esterase YcpF (UPF0227 family)